MKLNPDKSLREKFPNTEFFLVRIQSEYGKIRSRKNSVFGHFSHSECHLLLNTKEETTLKIVNLNMKNSLCEKLLVINFNYKLTSQRILKTFVKKHQEIQMLLQDWQHIYIISKTYSNECFLQVAI